MIELIIAVYSKWAVKALQEDIRFEAVYCLYWVLLIFDSLLKVGYWKSLFTIQVYRVESVLSQIHTTNEKTHKQHEKQGNKKEQTKQDAPIREATDNTIEEISKKKFGSIWLIWICETKDGIKSESKEKIQEVKDNFNKELEIVKKK